MRGPGDTRYHLVAGSAVAVTARVDNWSTPDDVVTLAWDSMWWLGRKLFWRGRGMIMVATESEGRRWVWTTPRRRAAIALLDKVEHLLANGRWVPGLTSMPELPGATWYSD